jgi:pilus assembly protein CpaC
MRTEKNPTWGSFGTQGLVLWTWLAIVLVVDLAWGQADHRISLLVGEQQIVDARDVTSFSESTKGVVEVKIPRSGGALVITALRQGSTSLLLLGPGDAGRTIHIDVFSQSPEAIEQELTGLLSWVSDLRVRRLGSRLFVDGRVAGDADLGRVERVVKLYQGQVVHLVALDSKTLAPRTNIRLDLSFVALRRSAATSGGVSWPSTLGAGGFIEGSVDLMTGSLAASYSIVNQALPSLEAASRAGWAKILKKAAVMATSGHRASYEAGGEVNVAVAGSQAAELRSVPYGARLSVLPRLDSGGERLDVEVEAEVSELTETTQDVPGRTVSRVSTLVHLCTGQSIVLGGLDSGSHTRAKKGLPGLSRIPLIGLLFGTHQKIQQEEENIIVITPIVLENLSGEGRDKLDEALKKYQEYRGASLATQKDPKKR